MARPMLARRASLARGAGVLIAILAMMIQSFVIQTHVHNPAEARLAAGTIVAGSSAAIDRVLAEIPKGKTPADKYPVDEDPANCPLCQEFHHSGAFVAPTAALFALPFYVHLSLIVFIQPVIAIRVLSHSWQGRAPPHI